MKGVLKPGIANSTVLQVWPDFGTRWKGMLKTAAPDAPLPSMGKDLHLALELARQPGVALPVGENASRVADAGIATGHDDLRLWAVMPALLSIHCSGIFLVGNC